MESRLGHTHTRPFNASARKRESPVNIHCACPQLTRETTVLVFACPSGPPTLRSVSQLETNTTGPQHRHQQSPKKRARGRFVGDQRNTEFPDNQRTNHPTNQPTDPTHDLASPWECTGTVGGHTHPVSSIKSPPHRGQFCNERGVAGLRPPFAAIKAILMSFIPLSTSTTRNLTNTSYWKRQTPTVVRQAFHTYQYIGADLGSTQRGR